MKQQHRSWGPGIFAGALAVMLGTALWAIPSHGSSDDSRKPVGDHYLMLVNTAIASKLYGRQIAQFDRSYYDGIAVTFSFNYDTSPPISPSEIKAKISYWQTITKKDIWPWVFINRILGVDDSQKNPYTTGPYFHRIQGADLEDTAGALKDFLKVWESSLRAARDSRVPGIVVDLEFYNYYKEYDLAELARLTGKKPPETINRLQKLGGQMADIAAEQYPDAILWFLFTGLGNPPKPSADHQQYLLSPSYVSVGLLDEIKKQHFRLKVISGGEVGLGYCHPSLRQFQQQIQDRAVSFAPYLQKYAGILELGGTMTVWRDPAAKSDWLKQSDCGPSPSATVEDLQPYLELLLKSYRYNWIYCGGDGYDAFQADSASRFDAMIGKAEANVIGTRIR